MLIFNTTFNINKSIAKKCEEYLEHELIPKLLETELFSKAIFAEVLAEEFSEGKTFSLQLFCPSKAHLSQFKKSHNHYITDMADFYKGKLVYFQTSMLVMSIKNC